MPPSKIQCCCGRSDCVYLEHNTAALSDLEKDVETAARLGQALLERHECYKSEADFDRTRMTAETEMLEKRKREVEAENARVVDENRDLLDQLESLNQAVAESDAHIKILTTTLESTQVEVRKLAASASRAARLEEQLNEMGNEQEHLQQSLIETEENEKSAIQRWRKAECKLRGLHDQVDKIETESRKEREKHVEILGRMERKRVVERELDTAAGRIKGAAAYNSVGQKGNGTNVVSHFVRDILQDNANLQLCVVELKEMLQSSDEEVRNLREQVLLHQPLHHNPSEGEFGENNMVPLSEELKTKHTPERISKEIHVHHHYHSATPSSQRKEKVQIPFHRRQKKRRPILPPTLLESPSRIAAHRTKESTSSTSTTISQISFSHSSAVAADGQNLPSLPNSPQSEYRTSSIFDRIDYGFDSSRPTSPESSVVVSPSLRPSHRKRLSDASFRSIYGATELGAGPPMLLAPQAAGSIDPFTMHQTGDGAEQPDDNGIGDVRFICSQPAIHEEDSEDLDPRAAETRDSLDLREDFPSLHRSRQVKTSTSHESLFSVSEMDIHTSSKTPSISLSSSPSFFPRTPNRVSSAGTIFSSTNIIVPKASITGDKTSSSLLASVASTVTSPRNPQNTVQKEDEEPANTATTPSRTQGTSIGKRMGGWVLERWSSTATLGSTVENDPSALSPATTMIRSPGINQKGPIFGLRPPAPTPTSIHPENVDQNLLQETLFE